MADYMPIDGLGIVVDFEKSHGAHLYDAKTDQFYLDFLSFYASNPLGFNHPRLTSPEVVEELGRVAIHKPSNSDIYSREMAEFLDVFVRHAKPDFMKYTFFIEGGALAVENALKTAFDWKVRKNLAAAPKKKGDTKSSISRRPFMGAPATPFLSPILPMFERHSIFQSLTGLASSIPNVAFPWKVKTSNRSKSSKKGP